MRKIRKRIFAAALAAALLAIMPGTASASVPEENALTESGTEQTDDDAKTTETDTVARQKPAEEDGGERIPETAADDEKEPETDGESPEEEQEQVDISRCLELQEALDASNVPVTAEGHTEQQADDEASVDINGGGTLYYATLEEAFAAANGKTATITMLADAERIFTDSGNPAPLAISGGTVTLDMNEKTLSGGGYGYYGIIHVSGGSLTVQGNSTIEVQPARIGLSCYGGTLTVAGIQFQLITSSYAPRAAILNRGGTIIINSSTITGMADIGQVHHWQGNTIIHDVTATGTTESFPKGVYYYENGSLKINGGSFSNITVDENNDGGVGSAMGLLGSGVTYRHQDGTWATGDELAAMYIENVTVQKIPLTTNPSAEISWYYGSGAHSLMMNAQPVADGTVTYEWYDGDTNLNCAVDAYPIPENLDVGTYTYTCAATCDGYTMSHDFGFEIKKSDTTFNGNLIVRNGDTETKDFTVDDTITVIAIPTATGQAPTDAAMMVVGLAEPTGGQMALFVDDTQVSAPAGAGEGGACTMTVKASDVLELGNVRPNGDPITLTARFVGNNNMADAAGTVEVNITAAVKVETGGAATYYDSIETAWTAANGKTAAVTLLADVTASAPLELTNGDVTFDGGAYTLTVWPGANGYAITVDRGKLTMQGGTIAAKGTRSNGVKAALGGTFVFTGGRIEASASGIGINAAGGTVQISGGEVSGYTGLWYSGDGSVQSSGGIFKGTKNAVELYKGKVGSLLGHTDTARYAFYLDNAPVTEGLEGKSLPAGTYTVEVCSHNAVDVTKYVQLDNEQHQMTCLACGHIETAKACEYTCTPVENDASDHTATCKDCGRTMAKPHKFDEGWQPDNGAGDNGMRTVRIIHKCSSCGYKKEEGTITYPETCAGEFPYGQPPTLTVTTTLPNAEYAWKLDNATLGTGSSFTPPVWDVQEGAYAVNLYISWPGCDGHPWDEGFHFTVTPAALSEDRVHLSGDKFIYNGQEQKPAVTADGLAEGTDYEVSYLRGSAAAADLTSAGEIKVIVTGKGNYGGKVEKTFRINQKALTIKASDQTLTFGQSISKEPGSRTVIGLCDGDTLESVVLTPNTEKVPGGKITPSGAVIKNAGGKDVTGNYAITCQEGKLTVSYMEKPGNILYNGTAKAGYYGRKGVAISAPGYTVSEIQDSGYGDSFTIPAPARTGTVKKTLYFSKDGGISDGVEITVNFDLTPPAGKVRTGARWWETLLKTVSFGHYAVKEYTVTIESADTGGSGIAETEYAIVEGDTQYTDADALAKAGITWLTYDSKNRPIVPEEKKCVIYARLTDHAGNVSYISTDGILLDKTPPVVDGLNVPKDRVKTATADIMFTVDEAADYYYVVLPDSAGVPSAADLIATCDPGAPAAAGGTAIAESKAAGSGVVTEGELAGGRAAVNVTADGLTPGSAYKVYAAAVDKTVDLDTGSSAGNVGEVKGSAAFTMKKLDQAAPVLTYTRRTEVGTGKITLVIGKAAGAQYSFDGGQTWTEDNEQGGFDASQTVILAIRMKETATHYQSQAQTVTVDLAKKDREAPPVFTLQYEANGEINYTVAIPLTEGCEYSFDGGSWSDHNEKTGVKVGETVTGYKRYKETDDSNASGAVSASEIMPGFTVKTPVITPGSGIYTDSVRVTITCGSPDAKICYTIDGSMPTGSSIRYTGPFTVTPTVTVKAVAIKEGFTDSAVAEASYTKKSSGDSGTGSGGGTSGDSGTGSGGEGGEGSGTGTGGGISGDSGTGTGGGSGTGSGEGSSGGSSGGSSSKRGGGDPAPAVPVISPAADPGTGTAQTGPGTRDAAKPKTGTALENGTVQKDKEPFIKGAGGRTGWDVIRAEEERAEDGKVIHVDMNGAAVVPGDIFDSIKGRDITITFDLGNGIVWSVDGKSVTADKAADIDLSVIKAGNVVPADLVNNVTGESRSIQIRLAHEGEFGFAAVLSINLGEENAGYTASLYYYHESAGELEWIASDTIAADGTASLAFRHASAYVIAIDGEAVDEKEGAERTEESKTGDSSPVSAPNVQEDAQNHRWFPAAGAIVVVTAAGSGLLFARKKKKEGQ